MLDSNWNDLEVASNSVVMQAARQFGEAFAASPHFYEFEQAYLKFRQDEEAQKAMREFQQKQAALSQLRRQNNLSEEDKHELESLRDRFFGQASVKNYAKAQEELVTFAQEIGDLLSNTIGLDYGNACRSNKQGGCCG